MPDSPSFARRHLAAALLVGAAALSVACGSDDPATAPAAEPTAAPAPAATPPPATPPPTIPPAPTEAAPPRASDPPAAAGEGEPAPEAALAAYRATQAAYRRGDAAAYGEGYAERLRCFFGRTGRGRADVLTARADALRENRAEPGAHRLRSVELAVLSATADEVELADYGWVSVDPSRRASEVQFHQKRAVLTRAGDGRWQIVAELPLTSAACGFTPPARRPPALWAALRDADDALIENCEGPPGSTMEDGYPGIGGSNGCDPLLNYSSVDVCGAEDDACLDRVEREAEALIGADGP